MEDREAILNGILEKLKAMILEGCKASEQLMSEFPRRLMFEYSLLGCWETDVEYVLKLETDDGHVRVVSADGTDKMKAQNRLWPIREEKT